MARIKPSVLVSDIRGSMAGTTFQQTQGGLIAKAKTSKAKSSSIRQAEIRHSTANLQSQWLLFDQATRDLWQTFANFARVNHKNSVERIVNGQQLFIKVNIIRLCYGHAILTQPGFSLCVRLTPFFTVDLVGSDLILTSSEVVDSLVEFVICYASVWSPITLNNPGSRLQLIKFATVAGTTFDITSAYETVFGRSPVVGDTVFFRVSVVQFETGLSSPLQEIKKTF